MKAFHFFVWKLVACPLFVSPAALPCPRKGARARKSSKLPLPLAACRLPHPVPDAQTRPRESRPAGRKQKLPAQRSTGTRIVKNLKGTRGRLLAFTCLVDCIVEYYFYISRCHTWKQYYAPLFQIICCFWFPCRELDSIRTKYVQYLYLQIYLLKKTFTWY